MMKPKLTHFVIFLLGILLMASSIAVGIGALHYSFQFDSKTENPSNWDIPLYEYQHLSEEEKQIIDAAESGEEFTFESSEPIPGREKSSLGNQKIMVIYPNQDTYYIFTHKIIFVPTEPAGYTAIAMLLAGIFLVGNSIRRHHFPHRNLLWQTS
jgi:hypothetical protein